MLKQHQSESWFRLSQTGTHCHKFRSTKEARLASLNAVEGCIWLTDDRKAHFKSEWCFRKVTVSELPMEVSPQPRCSLRVSVRSPTLEKTATRPIHHCSYIFSKSQHLPSPISEHHSITEDEWQEEYRHAEAGSASVDSHQPIRGGQLIRTTTTPSRATPRLAANRIRRYTS